MPPRLVLSLAMFLALVPVTLLVPGLNELIMEGQGGTETEAHAFMTINMLAGMVAVPLLMRRLPRVHHLRPWLAAMFLIDATAFLGMGRAESIAGLFAFRALDGAVHLPAVTLLMVAANRVAGARRGASLGALASALMLGITVGSPLGGWLVQRSPALVYDVGAAIFAAAALLCAALPDSDPSLGRPTPGSRYRWRWREPETWPPLGYAFMDRFSIGIFVSTFTLFLARVHQLDPGARGNLVALFMVPFAALCYPVGRLAERVGWFPLLVGGNISFGLVYGAYGVTPISLLPVAMVLSGIASAFIFAPSLLLVSELVKRGHGEGLFGVFQLAGSFGFLIGPIVGGVMVAVTGRDGRPAYEQIFAAVGIAELLLAAGTIVLLGKLARNGKEEAYQVET
ncbi:MAG TPA: MFS transporter [Gemmatimonadaceae bacterium]